MTDLDDWLEQGAQRGIAETRAKMSARTPREPGQAKPAKKRGKPEEKISVAVRSFIRYALPAAFVFKIQNETGRTSKNHLLARKNAGVVSGIPDLCVMWPGGGIAWLEVKAGRNTASVQQDHIHAVMRDCGQHVYAVWSADDAARALAAAGAPLRATMEMRLAAPERVRR